MTILANLRNDDIINMIVIKAEILSLRVTIVSLVSTCGIADFED